VGTSSNANLWPMLISLFINNLFISGREVWTTSFFVHMFTVNHVREATLKWAMPVVCPEHKG